MDGLLSDQDVTLVLAAMREGLQILDRELRYVFLNDAAAEHGRRAKSELLGRRMTECYPGIDQTDMFRSLIRVLEEKKPVKFENGFQYEDGTVRTFELRVAPCAVGIMVLSIDVTESRRLEEQFRQAQKMEAVGRLAGGLAHDFNNLLSVIIGHASLLLDDTAAADPRREDLEAICGASERGRALTGQLLAFSRQQVLTFQAVELNEALRTSERLLRRLIGEDIEFLTELSRSPVVVRADAGQLDQIVMNLVINARDAMPEGGKLTIETRAVVVDEPHATEHWGVERGPYVELSVSDTGVGMDREVQSRVFEPFFTTKGVGKGTGLGLATVFGIVKQSGGNVRVHSEPGCGTTFTVLLPAAEAADPTAVAEDEPTRLEGTERILLVEDQDDVREVTRAVLRRYGYTVLEARTAAEALLLCERELPNIHLVLTDVTMPRMSGPAMVERLLAQRPDLKVLYMSGYTGDALPDAAYLQKPLTPLTLARRVRATLDATPR
jgi:two-component system, cell cycle sensor histidine kinase and response regulator CckA